MIATKGRQRNFSTANLAEQYPKSRYIRKRVASLKPSPENTNLYRPASDDPDILKLADSIKKRGLLDPLIVTLDNFIVSGHRRYAALKLIGQLFATCKVLSIRRNLLTKDEYVSL